MSFYLDSLKRYKFKLLYDVIDTTKTWEHQIFRSSLDDYNDDGLIEYQIISIGVDNTSFFYKYYTYDYDLNGVSHSNGPYSVHLMNLMSGGFEIEFSPHAYFTAPSIDDAYQDLFEELGKPVIINRQKHVTVSVYYSSVYLMLHILPETDYQFIDDNISMNFQVYGDAPLQDISPYINTSISSPTELLFQIELGVVGVPTNYETDGAYEYYLEFVNVYKNPLDITESYDGCTGSNTATTVAYNGTYTNVLTASSGYTMDNADIHVYMDGEELDIETVYDDTTHTISVTGVTGDIVVTASAVKVNTYKFYSSDGLTLHATYTGPSIESILFTLSGTQRTLVINGSTTYTWTVAIPTGYSLIGLSDSASSGTFIVPLGIEFTNVFTNDMNFYETIVEDVVVPTTFTLNLYRNSAEKIRVDKTNFLETVGSASGTLRNSTQITTPVIQMEYGTYPDFNYVFIPQFNRYYYVEEIVSVVNGMWQLSLSVDVLMSNKDDIRAQYGLVERNQNLFDRDIADNMRSYKSEPDYEYVELENTIFNVDNGGKTLGGTNRDIRFVLTIVGGK